MKMDQCYSFTDSHTQCTAQPISCVVSLHIAAAFTHSSGDKSLASGDHGQWRRTRKRQREGGKKTGDGELKRNRHRDKENEKEREKDHK